MIALICFVLAVLASSFKSKSRLEAENAVLRHQLIVLRRKVRGRVQPTNNGRLFLVQMYRRFPSILKVVTIVQPETLVRWHRAGFRRYWGWKSNLRGGRPRIEIELRWRPLSSYKAQRNRLVAERSPHVDHVHLDWKGTFLKLPETDVNLIFLDCGCLDKDTNSNEAVAVSRITQNDQIGLLEPG
jgi:hypothetical protein